jgi:L-alanine-DL-glutamate epimerase-like enolase superfamily enzyme
MFHKGTRWVYQKPGWFGDFDNCLWDIAGKAAGLPVHALIGRVRDRFPCYLTGGDMDRNGYFEHIDAAREMGIRAYKFHTYKGGKADIPLFEEVREAVGPDFDLINDPVCSYDLREAIEVGRVMEELGFVWLEEPFHEQKMHRYQELCSALDMPVMANEMLMHDIGISTQWLMHGATDLLRANARHGTTLVLKMAHFAELYDTTIEMNAAGGVYGHIHATLGCCIDNTSYYEYMSYAPDTLRKQGEPWGMVNAPVIDDGHLAPTDLPGWGAEWDEDRFQSLIVAER